MKYLAVIIASSFIVSWSCPDSFETNYDHDRYFFIIEQWPALAELDVAADTVHAPAVKDSSAAGHTYYSIESIVPDSIRWEYSIKSYVPSNEQFDDWPTTGEPSNIVSGLGVDWSEGSTESSIKASYRDEALLKIKAPTSGWLVFWTYSDSLKTDDIKLRYRFDFNVDGGCNLSDFSFFGEDYGAHGRELWNLSDFSELGANYNKRALFELETEGIRE